MSEAAMLAQNFMSATSSTQIIESATAMSSCEQTIASDGSVARAVARKLREVLKQYVLNAGLQRIGWQLLKRLHRKNLEAHKRAAAGIDPQKLVIVELAESNIEETAIMALNAHPTDDDIQVACLDALSAYKFGNVSPKASSLEAVSATLRARSASDRVLREACSTACDLTFMRITHASSLEDVQLAKEKHLKACQAGLSSSAAGVLLSCTTETCDFAFGILQNIFREETNVDVAKDVVAAAMITIRARVKEASVVIGGCRFLSNILFSMVPQTATSGGEPAALNDLYTTFSPSAVAFASVRTAVDMGAFDLLAECLECFAGKASVAQSILGAALHASCGRDEGMPARRFGLIESFIPSMIKLMMASRTYTQAGAPITQWQDCCRVMVNLLGDTPGPTTGNDAIGLLSFRDQDKVQEKLVRMGVFEAVTELLILHPRQVGKDVGHLVVQLLEDALVLEATAGIGKSIPSRHVARALQTGLKSALAVAVVYPESSVTKALWLLGMPYDDIKAAALSIHSSSPGRYTFMNHDRIGFSINPSEQAWSARMHCAACGWQPNEEERLLACGRCRLAYYCTRACQKKHWQHHKPECSRVHRPLSPTPPPQQDVLRTGQSILEEFRGYLRQSRREGLEHALQEAEGTRKSANNELQNGRMNGAVKSYESAAALLWPFEGSIEAVIPLVHCLSNRAEALLRLNLPIDAKESIEDARSLIAQHEGALSHEDQRGVCAKLDHREQRAQKAIQEEHTREQRDADARAEVQAQAQQQATARAAEERRVAERQREQNAQRELEARQRLASASKAAQQAAAERAAAARAAEEKAQAARLEQQRAAAERSAAQLATQTAEAAEKSRATAAREVVLADRRRRRIAREADRQRAIEAAEAAVVAERDEALRRAEWADGQNEQRRRAREQEELDTQELELVLNISRQEEQKRRMAEKRRLSQAAAARDPSDPSTPPSEALHEDVECAICLEVVSPPVRPCGRHAMHIGCASQWRLKMQSGELNNGRPQQPSCPLCREPI